MIAENADRHSGIDSGFHGSPAARAIALFTFNRPPDHAPTAFWSASAFEEVSKIGPISMAYFPKDEFAQTCNASP
jgi:hypothetical protein